MTVREALDEASTYYPSVTRRDLETLLLHLVGRARPWLLAHPQADLSLAHRDALFALAARRAAREPLQYLTGKQEFFGLNLEVNPSVLIPRPETELLVEAVLDWAKGESSASLRIVDVGTGSGAIALALASHLPGAELWAVDLSSAALAVAQGNAERLGLASRVRFQQSDLLSTFPGDSQRFDVIASNPPYVPAGDAPEMQPEVRDHEPHLALFAEADGLSVYRKLIPQAWTTLRPGGLLAMEFGFGQREALADLMGGWVDVRFLDDYAGIPRVALARRP